MSAHRGLWQPGQSGNPNGRPSIKGEVETLARAYTSEAIETLAAMMRNSESDKVRIMAASALLNRGWGLPRQAIDGSLSLAPPKPIERMTLEETEAILAELRAKREMRRLAELEGPLDIDRE